MIAVPEAYREARICRIDPQLGIGPVVQGSDIEGLRLQGLFQGLAGKVQEPGRHEGRRIRVGCRIPRVQGQE